jgi:FMN-dependent NADH-azoreductase
MSLFRLDASIRTEGSHSRRIADIVEQEWREAYPDALITNREIGIEPLPSDAWANAVSGSQADAEHRRARWHPDR